MTSTTQDAARYIDAMTAAGYSIVLVEGAFPDGACGIWTGFPEVPPAKDPLDYPRTPRAKRALAAELRRRGLAIHMERHEGTS